MNLDFENILDSDQKTLELVRNWRNSEEIKRYMITDHYITKSEHEKWIKNLKTKNTAKAWLIKYNKKLVGLVYLSNINYKNRKTEWGVYIADESVRGKGVGSATLYKLMEYVFDEMNFHKMNTKILENNLIALRLYKKFGFKREGRLRKQLLRDGKPINVILMSLLKKDWASNKETIKSFLSTKFA